MADGKPPDARPVQTRDAEPRGRLQIRHSHPPVLDGGDPAGMVDIIALSDGGWQVRGVIDIRNHDFWAAVLDRIASGGRGGRMYLTDLRFISVRAVAMLVAASAQLPPGDHVRLIDPCPTFLRVFEACWPNGVPSLLVERTRP